MIDHRAFFFPGEQLAKLTLSKPTRQFNIKERPCLFLVITVLSTRRNPVDKIVLKLSGQETMVVPTFTAVYPLLRI
jgi:hypothetical protein